MYVHNFIRIIIIIIIYRSTYIYIIKCLWDPKPFVRLVIACISDYNIIILYQNVMTFFYYLLLISNNSNKILAKIFIER